MRSSRTKALNFSRLTKCTACGASGTIAVSTLGTRFANLRSAAPTLSATSIGHDRQRPPHFPNEGPIETVARACAAEGEARTTAHQRSKCQSRFWIDGDGVGRNKICGCGGLCEINEAPRTRGLLWLQQLNSRRDYWIAPVVVMERGLIPAATAAPTLVSTPVVALMV